MWLRLGAIFAAASFVVAEPDSIQVECNFDIGTDDDPIFYVQETCRCLDPAAAHECPTTHQFMRVKPCSTPTELQKVESPCYPGGSGNLGHDAIFSCIDKDFDCEKAQRNSDKLEKKRQDLYNTQSTFTALNQAQASITELVQALVPNNARKLAPALPQGLQQAKEEAAKEARIQAISLLKSAMEETGRLRIEFIYAHIQTGLMTVTQTGEIIAVTVDSRAVLGPAYINSYTRMKQAWQSALQAQVRIDEFEDDGCNVNHNPLSQFPWPQDPPPFSTSVVLRPSETLGCKYPGRLSRSSNEALKSFQKSERRGKHGKHGKRSRSDSRSHSRSDSRSRSGSSSSSSSSSEENDCRSHFRTTNTHSMLDSVLRIFAVSLYQNSKFNTTCPL